MVRWVARRSVSAASPKLSGIASGRVVSATAATSRNRRWVKRAAPATPASVHSMSRSGGLSESTNQRAVSAP